MDWLVVRSQAGRGAARFTHIEDYGDVHLLKNAVPLVNEFPPNAKVTMNSDAPADIALADSLASAGAYLIVNEAVKSIFSRNNVTNVEYLPIQVINHKKTPVKQHYFVVNIMSHIDCINLDKSEGIEWNDEDSELIYSIEKLVIDAEKVPKEVKLFRPVHMKHTMFIRRDLADSIEVAELSGFRFTEIDDFSA